MNEEFPWGINLLSVVGKVLRRILNEGVKVVTDDKLMDEQGGFRTGRGCNNQIFASSILQRRLLRRIRRLTMSLGLWILRRHMTLRVGRSYGKCWMSMG